MYEKELLALQKANRFRERIVYSDDLVDLASNDYLGLAEDKMLFADAVHRVRRHHAHAPKASQLVTGYHPVHSQFEEYLCGLTGFSAAMVVGSGFLANLALIEALPRKRNILILDEYYHASGILASKLLNCEVVFFKHNDPEDLERILKAKFFKRAIVAVEGIYSMEGDLLNREIFNVVDAYNALLIVDEAHSSGVIGENLLGIFDYYNIRPKENYIKMGTLGKAMGSYGAYILASDDIILFLQNRAKAVIYATAPSIFDIALGHAAMQKVEKEKESFKKALQERIDLAKAVVDPLLQTPILKIEVESSEKVMRLKDWALQKGFLLGAIRPPTVQKAMLRIILRTPTNLQKLEFFLKALKIRCAK